MFSNDNVSIYSNHSNVKNFDKSSEILMNTKKGTNDLSNITSLLNIQCKEYIPTSMKGNKKATEDDIITKFLQDDCEIIYHPENLFNSSNILPQGLDVNFVYNNMLSS